MVIIGIDKRDKIRWTVFACDYCKQQFERKYRARDLKRTHRCAKNCPALGIKELECFHCGKLFKQRMIRKNLEQKHFFCSNACVNKAQTAGGVLHDIKRQKYQQSLGVDWPMQSSIVKEKSRMTCMDRYGVPNSAQAEHVQAKLRATNLERYGFECVLGSPEIRERAKQTSRERYGTDFPSQSQCVRDQTRETCMERYGVSVTSKADCVKKKMRDTNMERYGGPAPMCSEQVQKKAQETWLSIYGVDHPSKDPTIFAKILETTRLNRKYYRSKPEDACHEMLCELFGEEDIIRQKHLHRWPIDFYIKSQDCYLQLDGVYWHGLNRPLDEIKQFKYARDRTICAKYRSDREQERWCAEHEIRLVRVTDVQFKKMKPQELRCLIGDI